jgi:hypothetical protein
MRYRKNDPAHNLLVAASRFIRAKGGSLLIIGPIEVQEWPEDRAGMFRLAVKCLGRKPNKEAA